MNEPRARQSPRSGAPVARAAGSVALAVAVWGCSDVPTTEVSSTRQAIEDGEVDEHNRSVFRIITRSNGFNSLCSSTLIAPNLLLTARHCVAETAGSEVSCARDEFGDTAQNGELLFANDTEPDIRSRWYAPTLVAVQEEVTSFCGQDIALVVLSDNVPTTDAVPSAPRLTPALSVGEEYSAVGYGASDDTFGTAEYGVRRSRSGLSIECLGARCGAEVVEGEFAGLEGACRGDSGGPALDTTGRVMGTLSRGAAGCESPIYTSVAAFEDWVVEVARWAAQEGGYPLPEWAGGDAPVEAGDNVPPEAEQRFDAAASEGDATDPQHETGAEADDEAADGMPLAAESGCMLGHSRPFRGGGSLLLVTLFLFGLRGHGRLTRREDHPWQRS